MAEVLAEECPAPMRRVGVKERYGGGHPAFLQQEYGLTAEHIPEAAGQLLQKQFSSQ